MTRANKIGPLIVGLGLVILAALAGFGFLLAPLFAKGQRAVSLASAALGVAFVAGILGAGLLWERRRARKGEPPRELHLPSGWFWLLGTAIGVAGGVIAQRSGGAPYLFPPFHALTLVTWVGLLFSLVCRWLPRLTVYEAVSQLTYGAFAATALSGLLEVGLLLFAGIAALALILLLPAGPTWLEAIQGVLQDPWVLGDPRHLAQFLLTPPIAVALVGSLVIIVPLVEEGVKSLGVFFLPYRLSDRNRYLAWGVLSGLGFALVEGLFNAAVAGPSWVFVVGVRVLTMSLHALTGGLMGGGWYYAVHERRVWNLAALYLLSFALHALWNGIAALGGLATVLLASR